MVDEYQDTNHAQYRIANLLAGAAGNLAVVGDDDQSIYSWRGADIRNILEFERDHPDAKVIRLEQNYRSTTRILDVANAVVSNNRRRKGKNLWTARGTGRPAHVVEVADEHAEARYIASEVRKLLDEGAVSEGSAQARPARAARHRRALPHQRPVARARRGVRALRDRLPGRGRHALLRARRGQRRARLPGHRQQPGRRAAPAAHREHAAPRPGTDRHRTPADRGAEPGRAAVERDRARRRPARPDGAAAASSLSRFAARGRHLAGRGADA